MDDQEQFDSFETVDVQFTSMGRSGSEQILNTGVRMDVTPPEYMILEEKFGRTNLKIVSEKIGMATEPEDGPYTPNVKGKKKKRVARTHEQEIDRLRGWYGQQTFKNVFPEKNPRLPYTFHQARIPVKIPDNVTKITSGKNQAQQSAQLAKAISGQQGGGQGDGNQNSA